MGWEALTSKLAGIAGQRYKTLSHLTGSDSPHLSYPFRELFSNSRVFLLQVIKNLPGEASSV
jgi:hypothetical protein